MPRRNKSPESAQSIPEMADEVTRAEMRLMYKDGKLTAYGRRMSKFQERALPEEKVDEWGWNLSRKERAERHTLKRFPPINRKLQGKNGRKSCARSSAASRGWGG